MKAIISGGGTGGHIFPAIAIANALREEYPDSEILFIGAKGKMEMQKVPQSGYQIIGLPIAGFQRKKLWKNFLLPFKVLYSTIKARRIIKSFAPDVVIGVGGYASGPTLAAAVSRNIPTLIQEQNSYPGVTNKMLADKVNVICVAYDNMDRWFDRNKIVYTGNPIRQIIARLYEGIEEKRKNATETFDLSDDKKTVLVVGGSLGALTINESICKNLDYFDKNNIQLIWQTGKWYYPKAKECVEKLQSSNIKVHEFIYEMDQAYSLADVIISRAGAIAISELCIVGKPSILVPSPNVSEDHQTKNANALVAKNAALMVKDIEARESLITVLDQIINDEQMQKNLSENIKNMGIRSADKRIVEEINKIIKR
ncbi:MAG: undecaprenyldiphospho-muramoylpentapeptide beta-N-acetylglucosaminyltransferase [Bacteroidales bacterium]|jgi:UDP-N-acetylglucosamine--N-acetylmuramyl-(pentapeptide) pyrophosphoryl-undecaprenol N-acetylglucosamine transferase|nr:undecaprenyldiphospho-muramoylpentapeptide beta-N-acetylglucosaminyltransferase [Bacteroidales bacterium]MEE1097376.1 undecaprenyldiphospho-muramoylpentapeptide beta-N-acetylglucosaminyltransferase [Bacteroidales bacterium]